MKRCKWIVPAVIAAVLAAAVWADFADDDERFLEKREKQQAPAKPATPKGRMIEEGFLVAGVEGRVAKDPNERWVFYPAAAITDGKAELSAEMGVLLLPCSVLEQMIGLAGQEQAIEVRLWAMVTGYRAVNYLYSLYFLPMKAAAEPSQIQSIESETPTAETKPRKESVLPSEILQMIEKNPIPDLKRLEELVVVTSDRNMIHRMGLVEGGEGDFVFRPDAFGQNVDRGVYYVLPSRELEEVQRNLQKSFGRQRYVVSGVITGCQGKNYVLVRRAVRTFTHGNFTP